VIYSSCERTPLLSTFTAPRPKRRWQELRIMTRTPRLWLARKLFLLSRQCKTKMAQGFGNIETKNDIRWAHILAHCNYPANSLFTTDHVHNMTVQIVETGGFGPLL
jgi:hypothetical protein